MSAKIYAIRDNHWIRYVGKTVKSLETRLAEHLRNARDGEDTHKGCGIRKMLREGKLPTITLITTAEGNGFKEEMKWIAYFQSRGIKLWNETAGGEGVTMTTEIRAKIGRGNKGKQRTEETRKKLCIARANRVPFSPEKQAEIIARIIAKTTGQKRSPEQIQRISDSQKGKVLSVAHRAAVSKGLIGRIVLPITRERIRKALKGRPFSEEHKKNLRGVKHVRRSLKEVKQCEYNK